MKIAVIGAGGVGRALGSTWARQGHEVCYGARNVASEKVVASLRATPGSTARPIAEAVAWADAVMLATAWSGARDALAAAGDFGGKPLLDATNPLTPSFQLEVGHTTSGGEQVQAWAPTASVVKIFNTTGLENMADPVYPEGRATMLYAGGDARAKQVAARLAGDLGFDAVDFGALDGARYLEPAAMVWIKLALVLGHGRHVAFRLMRRQLA